MTWRFHWGRALLWFVVVLVMPQGSRAYSVLTHEQVVDLLWADRLQPRPRPVLLRQVLEVAASGRERTSGLAQRASTLAQFLAVLTKDLMSGDQLVIV
jgi:hypothetical protein